MGTLRTWVTGKPTKGPSWSASARTQGVQAHRASRTWSQSYRTRQWRRWYRKLLRQQQETWTRRLRSNRRRTVLRDRVHTPDHRWLGVRLGRQGWVGATSSLTIPNTQGIRQHLAK